MTTTKTKQIDFPLFTFIQNQVMAFVKSLLFLLLSGSAFSLQAQDFTNKASIYFPFNSSIPDTESLQNLQEQLSKARYDSLILTAHCDAIGSDQYNDSLSEKRKEAVVQWLQMQKLISTQKVKLIAIAQGEHKPLNANATDEERRLNRRVEVQWNTIRQVIETHKVIDPIANTDSVKLVLEKPALEIQTGNMSEQIERAKETGQTLVLNNINFVGGRAVFLSTATPTLKELLKVMRDNPELRIEIQGHVCCTLGGSDGPNLDSGSDFLSVDRAKAVYDYLVYNGIEESRLRYKGFGGSKRLVYPEQTEGDRTRNRRVEIMILKD